MEKKTFKNCPNTKLVANTPSLLKMELGHPCTHCGALTNNKEIAKLHNDAHYTGYSCSQCPQAFLTKHVFEMHLGMHEKISKTYVEDGCQCKLCESAFLSLLYLEFHLIEFHGRDALGNPDVIRMEIVEEKESNRMSDSREKFYRCGICFQLFEFGANLECHMVLHEGGKFDCGKCSATFSISDVLQMHVNSKHIEIDELEDDSIDPLATINKPIQIRGGIPKSLLDKWKLERSKKISPNPSRSVGQESTATTAPCPRRPMNSTNETIQIPFHEECQYANVFFHKLNLSTLPRSVSAESDLQFEKMGKHTTRDKGNQNYINPYLIKVFLKTKNKNK